jgi:hypothetical protein
MVTWKCRWCGGWSSINWDGLDKCEHCERLRSVVDNQLQAHAKPEPEDGDAQA